MAQEGFKRKLAAVLSADVKGYSRLMREDETATIRTLTAYREVITGLIKQHHGRIVDAVGDNVLAEFASVVDAVQGAVAIQKEIKTRNAQVPESHKMLFRIGINLGDLVVEGDRIYGDGVNIAARLEAMADPGGICISRTAYDQIEDKLPLGYEYLGEKAVKNIEKPVRAYRVLLEHEDVPQGMKVKEQTVIRTEHRRRKESLREKHDVPRGRPTIRFSQHLRIYLSAIGFLLLINILTWPGVFWVHWPALGWGLLLYFHWLNVRPKEGRKDEHKERFQKHLGVYLGVIGFLLIINILTWGGVLWVHWPALGWGLFLFLFRPNGFKSSHRSKK